MRAVILNQRKERDELLERHYLERKTKFNSDELLANNLIKLVSGPRRVGKSTYALLMLKGKNFAYLNFDDDQLLAMWEEETVMQMLDEVYPNYEYMLLDEVQNLNDWDLWISKLYRRGKNLIVTGSNAKMLSSEMATVLTGRYIQIDMMPFSMQEVAEWNNTDIRSIADEYLHNGGYPETVQARSIVKNYLFTLFDNIVWKDVCKRHKVRNSTDLNTLAVYLLTNFCNHVSANDLKTELGFSSVTTTKKFMDFLHEPFLFFFLMRYDNKMKIMKKAAQKVYVVDNGFVTSRAFNISENIGRLLENQTFTELLRRGYNTDRTLFYYRSRNDKEIDFVIRDDFHVKQLIQVSYTLTNAKTEKREVDALVEAAGELHCSDLLIVTADEERTIEKNGYTIKVTPIYKM
ncbi:MAG: ATP-binding protein [Prevotella sp.]|nr:ATP-binding protein [Prevotella sp.]